MEQYRITSADFVAPGETGDTDAIIDMTELDIAANRSKLVTYMQDQITKPVDLKFEDAGSSITIIREQKYNG